MVDENEAGESCGSESAESAWISLGRASRLLKRHPTGIKNMALAGGIRYRAMPGARVEYCRVDVEKLAGAGAVP